MKFAKKISAVLLILCLSISYCSIVAYAADGSITFTDPETAVGEMVDITCVVRSLGEAFGDVEIGLKYDSAALRFDSGEGVTSAGDGALTYRGNGGAAEESFTMTFQALAEGSAKVTVSSVSATTGYGAELALEEGDSTVTIAEGDPSKITAQGAAAPSAGDIQVEVNGVSYTLTDSFGDMEIPEGYTRTSVTLEGQARQMVVNSNGTIYLGYLIDGANVGDFFVYNEKNATFSPYEEISISDTTSIIVLSDVSKVKLPETYQETTLTLNGNVFPVWQNMEKDRYYIFYAMNNSGDTGYYQYDSYEDTYQRVEITAEAAKEEKEDSKIVGKVREFLDGHLKLALYLLGALAFIIFIFIIVLAVKLRNRNLELDDLYDEYGIDMDEEEPKKPAVKDKKTKSGGGLKTGRHKYEDNFFDDDDDDFDEDDFEEEDFDEDDFEEAPPVRRRLKKTAFDEDDFEEEDLDEDDFQEEDDIFSDKNIKKYDTKAIRRGMHISELDDTDGLGELMEDLSMGDPGHQEKDDAFNVDIVDLD